MFQLSEPPVIDQDRAAYLFFRFRIETISKPRVSKIINSSYVLISIPLSARLGTGEGRPTGCPVKHIILSGCGRFLPVLTTKRLSVLPVQFVPW